MKNHLRFISPMLGVAKFSWLSKSTVSFIITIRTKAKLTQAAAFTPSVL